MDILKLSQKHTKLQEESDEIKRKLVSELNIYIRPMYNRMISDNWDIRIERKILDKNLYHYLAGYDVLEIWETDLHGDSEYAASYLIPISILKDKTIAKTHKEIQAKFKQKQKEWEKERIKKAKEYKEEHDKKEFKRLKRKFNKSDL